MEHSPEWIKDARREDDGSVLAIRVSVPLLVSHGNGTRKRRHFGEAKRNTNAAHNWII